MQRTISLFLLLIILLAGMNPVLSMHYCGGDLFSVSIADSNENDHSCCAGKGAGEESAVTCEDCCDLQQVQLSTDDYNHQQVQQIDSGLLHPAFTYIWVALYNLVNPVEMDDTILARHYFPPQGLNRLNIDLLTSICIYRI